MEDYVIRMIEERNALNEKITKAEKYVQEHEEPTMSYSMTLLCQQILIMKAYENVLQLRIDDAPPLACQDWNCNNISPK